jgi:hypothetical protein
MTDEERREKNRKYMREYARRWRAANPGKAAENQRRWRTANPERNQRNLRKWRDTNREKVRAAGRRQYAASGTKKRDYARQWRSDNREKVRAAVRKYREAHREASREYARQRRIADPEKNRENGRKWRLANPAKAKESMRQWRVANPDKVLYFKLLRLKRIKQATPPWADRKALRAIENACPTGHVPDHIYPIRGITPEGYRICGLHIPENLRYLTEDENKRRHNRMIDADLTATGFMLARQFVQDAHGLLLVQQ